VRLLRRKNNDAAPNAANGQILPDRTPQSSIGGVETRYARRLDDDDDDAVAELFRPVFTHLFLNQIRMPIQITASVAAEITEPIIRSITPA